MPWRDQSIIRLYNEGFAPLFWGGMLHIKRLYTSKVQIKLELKDFKVKKGIKKAESLQMY